MARFANGIYEIQNPKKYVGNTPPRFRSSWEATYMRFLDTHPNILQWASESIRLPYRHPLTNRIHTYIPDFFVVYLGPDGKPVAEIVEIKPLKQSINEGRKMKQKDAAVVAVNHAKWASAKAYCKQQGFTFRIITEHQIFYKRK